MSEPSKSEITNAAKPQRIQLKRLPGFNLQKTSLALNGLPAVNCARPSKWGNPFRVGRHMPLTQAINLHSHWIQNAGGRKLLKDLHELRGKNLACYCPVTQECHCDILLQLANGEIEIPDQSPFEMLERLEVSTPDRNDEYRQHRDDKADLRRFEP